MPVSYSSPARNLFLLGTTGQDVVTNFFDKINRSTSGYFSYVPTEVIKNTVDEEILLGLNADEVSPSQRNFGIVEKRLEDGTQEWENFISATNPSGQAYLRDIHLDSNNNIIACGYADGFPFVVKYDNDGVIDWQSTSSSGSVEYNSVTSDSNGNYYACGNTPETGDARAFVEKFDTNGNPGWGKSAFMLGRDIIMTGIAANSRGHVVAVGYLEDDTADKGYIIKIDTSTGEVLWDRTLEIKDLIEGTSTYSDQHVRPSAVVIDDNDDIYIAATYGAFNAHMDGAVLKYTAEGNLLWQSATDRSNSTINYVILSDIAVDNASKKASVIGYTDIGSILISRYESDGRLSWRREAYQVANGYQTAFLDVDQSFTYFLFDDALNQYDYTFGKVSATGNGLGDFEYSNGDGSGIPVQYVPTTSQNGSNIREKIGRLSDGSVRNDTSDLLTYPFNANKLLFDDLATQVTNKRRQMDSADSFEYSGSPAVRPVDFPSLYLDAKNDARNGTVVDPDSGIVGTYNTFGPFTGSNSVYLGGTNADSNTYGWQGYVDLYQLNTSTNSAAATLDIGTDLWTMEAWFYITEYPSNRAILMTLRHSQYTSNPDTLLINSSGTLEYAYQEGVNGSNSNTIPLNTWVHIAMAKDPTDDTRTMVLINGTCSWKPGNGRTTGHSNTDNFYARLGWSLFSFTTNYQYLKGYISNYRFSLDNVYGTSNIGDSYTVPTSTLGLLPSTKILALHKGLSNTVHNGGSSFYGILDQTTCEGPWASISNDLFTSPLKHIWVAVVPNYRNAQVRGAKIYGLTDRVNRERGYWEFNGVDDNILIDKVLIDSTEEHTFEAWFNTNSTTTTQYIVDQSPLGPNSGGFLRVLYNGNSNLQFLMYQGGGFQLNVTVQDAITANQWHHVVGTVKASTNETKLYLDGVEIGSANTAFTTLDIPPAGTKFAIGSDFQSSDSYFNGNIGEVRIYPRALTAAQVFQNYNATKTTYINEEPTTAPKIGPGIVYDNNLLLNYDFGNRATFNTKDTSFTKITPPTAGNGANFGYHTRQLSNGFVTGEPWNSNGVVYWYDKNGSNVATVADPTNSGSWGYYLFSDGDDRVLVNAPYYNDGSTEGFLYVYDGSGNLQYTIPRPEYDPSVNHPNWSSIEEICAIGEGKIAVMDARFYDPGTTNQRGAVWIMDEDGTNQVRILSPEVSPGSGTFNEFNYNIFIDNGYVYVYTSIYGSSVNTWTVIDFNGNIIRNFLPAEDGTTGNEFGYPVGAGGGRFIIHSRGDESLGIPAKTYIYDSTNNFNLVGTFESEYGNPNGGDYGTQSFYVSNGHIYAAYDDKGVVVSYDLNGNFEKVFTGPQYLSLSRLSNGRDDYFGYNNLIDFGDGSYVIAASYDSDSDGAVYILKATTVKNLASSSYTGTISGAEFNSAGYFVFDNANNDEIISSTTTVADTGIPGLTVEVWANLSSSTVFGTDGTSWLFGEEGRYRIVYGINYLQWVCATANNNWYTAGTTITPGSLSILDSWHHIVGVYDGTNVRLDLDGTTLGTSTSAISGNVNSGGNPLMSLMGTDAGNVGWGTGSIGQVRIYNRALSSTEVSQNYNATRGKYGV